MHRRRSRALTVGAVALGTALQPFGTAPSANFGSTACGGTPRTCVSVANNSVHAVRFASLGEVPYIADATQWALTYQYNPTDLLAYRDDLDPYPDVVASDSNFGNNGLVAWVECPTDNTGESGTDPYRSCRGQRLRYNSWFWLYDTAYDTQAGRRKIACHELGHTLGLRHWDQYHTGTGSCMYNPPVDATVEGLNTHDRDHINGYYS